MNKNTPDRWAQALRAERKRLSMTQTEFGVLLGYGPYASTVCNIEAGRWVISPRTRIAIEAALGKRLLG